MSKSLWQKLQIVESNNLTSSLRCEICIVGAGIAGLTVAYRLISHGIKVVVIHSGDLKAGETSKSTAQINTIHDDGWADMLNLHGQENLGLCYQSYLHAFAFIKDVITKNKLDCGYEKITSYLFTDDPIEGANWIDKEIEAAQTIGVKGIKKVSSSPLPEHHKGPALFYDDQAQFHPLAYLSELRRLILESGLGQIYGNAGVKEIIEGEEYTKLLLDSGAVVSAANVVLATNVPIYGRLIPIEALAAYRSYVVAFRVKKNSVPNHQYWDNQDPYHYIRLGSAAADLDHPDADYDILLVGGEDHRVGDVRDVSDHYKSLIEWGHKHFPVEDLTGLKWSAQTIETFDGMPLIGPCPTETKGKIFIITGDSGTGITHGTIGGLMIADQLVNITSPWEKIYSPSRSRAKSIKRWAVENVTGIISYHDWFTPGEVNSEEEILPGSGAIIRTGVKKIAIYKDEDGTTTRLSAVCPHLGAIVRWNTVEKSWDCPAHGSRYSPTGEVLNGPAHCSLTCLDKNELKDEIAVNEAR